MCGNLGFGNELRHLVSDASSEVPHITVSLLAFNQDFSSVV